MNQLNQLNRISYDNGKAAGVREVMFELNERINKGYISNFFEVKMFMLEATEAVAARLDALKQELESINPKVG